MQPSTQTGKALFLVTAVVLAVAALVVVGCTAGSPLTSSNGTTINTAATSVPISITDDPGDQVLAASLTLNSVVLKNASGGTASLLTAPLTFEATHLDAVQEPLFTPAVPQDTYVSATLSYTGAVVAYFDASSKSVVVNTNPTLANATQTITFSTPITVGNTKTALLIDYLVAKSVAISGSTVTVTPTFHISAAPIRAQPTNGTDGLECGVKGKISALGTNQFTLINPAGISMTVTVNSNTTYQGNGLTAFSGLTVGMFVEVDLELQTDGTILAERVEQEVPPTAVNNMLVGPVTAVTGSPATSFEQVARQQIGIATSSPVQKNTITITSSTKFIMPGRFTNVMTSASLPFTPTFDASSIFKGQVVAVATSGVTNNTATALAVKLAPQTIGGTITAVTAASCMTCWAKYTVTLPSDSWLAALTGKTTVVVYSPPVMQAIASSTAAMNSNIRFNGFLFSDSGTLTMIGLVQGPGPGTPIDQH